MKRLAAAAALLCGCSTVIPAQTASTVDPGGYRVGGQLTAAPYCTLGGTPIESCQSAPSAPLPEVRLSGRYGLAPAWDLGLSLHAVPAPASGFRGGAFLDGKYLLWASGEGDTRALLSLGLGGGLSTGLPTATRPSLTQVELALPLFAGWQTRSLEWVLSPRVVERLAFADVEGDGNRDLLPVTELGLSVALFTRTRPAFFAQVGYSAPTTALTRGPFSLAVGLTLDVPRAGTD